jgi:integrase/recombinase XerC/integrase/recombinase XerD
MKPLTTEVPQISLYRRDELRNDTPLTVVVQSFFISNSMKPKTHDFYSTHLRGFAEFVETNLNREARLEDVNHEYVNTYIRMLEKKPTAAYPNGSPFRARAAATTLKRFANWLVDDGILKGDSPLKKVKKTKELMDVRQPLSDEELQQVLDSTTPGTRNHAMVVFGAGTGLRLNELRGAVVSDISLKNCSHIVRAEVCKVGKARTVVFHEDVAKIMDKYLRSRDLKATDPLFPTDEGTVFKEDSIGKVFQRLAKESGVRRFHAHLLRHTWATNFMLGEHANLLQLQALGGWTKIDMVARYSKPAPADRSGLPNPTGNTKVVKFSPKKVSGLTN